MNDEEQFSFLQQGHILLCMYSKKEIIIYRKEHINEKDVKNRWNLVDYGDVVVHVLHREERESYAIEKFWNHAFTVDEEKWLEESELFADMLR